MTTYYKTAEGERVGPKMKLAVESVEKRGYYASILQLSKRVSPGVRNGYPVVKRCKRKGLLQLDADHDGATPQGRGAVVLTEKGKRFLESLE